MARPLFIDKRLKPRKMLTGLLPGPLVNDQGRKISCKPVDISEDGIGILTSELLKVGDELSLQSPDETVVLKVSWGKRDFGKQNLYRYGLNSEGETQNLEKIFLDSGCLK
ncbi:MAG: hypothetical protein ACOH5I_02340 [Oligoflexus sp.]